MTTWLVASVALVSFLSGATASTIGFGVGSLLTPVVALWIGAEDAVTLVAIPHLAGGLLRGWQLRRAIDWQLAGRFGLLSALGALLGAFVFARISSSLLTGVLGALLVMTAATGVRGWPRRWSPRTPAVSTLGALSGFFGGVVGNQGGLRAAALSAFDLAPPVFVATSTVIGIMIDLVRVPVYLSGGSPRAAGLWPMVGIATVGVLAGTVAGDRVLLGLSPERFRIAVSIAVGILGLWFILGSA